MNRKKEGNEELKSRVYLTMAFWCDLIADTSNKPRVMNMSVTGGLLSEVKNSLEPKPTTRYFGIF